MTPRLNVGRLATFAVALVAVAPLAAALGQEASASGGEQAAGQAEGGQSQPTIQSYQDKISYAFGADLARDILRQKGNLNIELLMRAFTDAIAGRPLIMTDEQVTAAVKEFDANQKRGLQHARMMVAEKNKKSGEAFFAENAKKDGVVTLPSGLQYKILKKGEGRVPTIEDTVVCNYRGTLVDGAEFDNSAQRGKEGVAVPVKAGIAGLTEALQMMPVGSKWELYIPPQLAYGDKETPAFGPNSTLIFEVELLSIKEKAQTLGAAQAR